MTVWLWSNNNNDVNNDTRAALRLHNTRMKFVRWHSSVHTNLQCDCETAECSRCYLLFTCDWSQTSQHLNPWSLWAPLLVVGRPAGRVAGVGGGCGGGGCWWRLWWRSVLVWLLWRSLTDSKINTRAAHSGKGGSALRASPSSFPPSTDDTQVSQHIFAFTNFFCCSSCLLSIFW